MTKVKCNLGTKTKCEAGKLDNKWMEKFVYCDHYVEHEKETTCAVICKIDPEAKCERVS